MTPLIIAAVLFVGLIAINVSFFLCARAIRRDHKKRFDDLQRQCTLKRGHYLSCGGLHGREVA